MLAAIRRTSSRLERLGARLRTEAARKKRSPMARGGHGDSPVMAPGGPERTDLNRLKRQSGDSRLPLTACRAQLRLDALADLRGST